MILLDTNALIWLIMGDTRLGLRCREMIQSLSLDDPIALSAFTFWEIAMVVEKGRLNLGLDLGEWTSRIVKDNRFRIQPVTPSIAIDAGRLPGSIHGDPADRMIIATSRHLECALMTADGPILRYAAEGHVRVIDARH